MGPSLALHCKKLGLHPCIHWQPGAAPASPFGLLPLIYPLSSGPRCTHLQHPPSLCTADPCLRTPPLLPQRQNTPPGGRAVKQRGLQSVRWCARSTPAAKAFLCPAKPPHALKQACQTKLKRCRKGYRCRTQTHPWPTGATPRCTSMPTTRRAFTSACCNRSSKPLAC